MVFWDDIKDLSGQAYLDLVCDYCGKPFRRKVRKIKRRPQFKVSSEISIFCSVPCVARFTADKRAEKFITKTCKYCKKEYQTRNNKRGRNRRFCSRNCADKGRHTKQVNEKLSKKMRKICKPKGIEGVDYQVKIVSGRTVITRFYSKNCIICGQGFRGTKNRKTCSNICKSEYIGRKHRQRIKDMTAEEFKKFIGTGRFSGRGHITRSKSGELCRSKFEAEVLNFLTDNGIKFKYEPLIPEANKIADLRFKDKIWEKGYYIELDGLYRNMDDPESSWTEKIQHYEDLWKRKVIDGFLVVTPKTYRSELKRLLKIN